MPVLSRVQIGTSGEYESMKSRETLIRLKKFQVDEKRRRVAQIEGMIADFQRMSVDLEREIQSEQERAGINDPSHFAYPTYAKAAIQRRENLTRSADELRIQLEDAKALLGEAFEELKKVELLDERDQARERAEESAREQADMDSIGLMRARIAMAWANRDAEIGKGLVVDEAFFFIRRAVASLSGVRSCPRFWNGSVFCPR